MARGSLLAHGRLTVAQGYLLIRFFFRRAELPWSMWRWVRGRWSSGVGRLFDWEGIPMAVKGATDALVSAGFTLLLKNLVSFVSLLLIPLSFTAIAVSPDCGERRVATAPDRRGVPAVGPEFLADPVV